MKVSSLTVLDALIERYPVLLGVRESILSAFGIIADAYEKGKKLLVCGNGGSAADSEHIVGELMKSFKKRRPIDAETQKALSFLGERGELLGKTLEGTLRAIALTTHTALSTAFANDKLPAATYAQQVYGYADRGDVLLAISTSGNAENCALAAVTARAKGVRVVALTGKNESKLSSLADVSIRVPETETYKVQELHLPVYHCLCAMLEEEFF